MKHTRALRTGIVFLLLALTFWTTLVPVLAHEGHEHEDTDYDASQVETVDIAKLEQVITLLNQLILLINALHIQQGYAPVATVPAVTHDDATEMEEHHDEHGEDVVLLTPIVHLVIEVETHHDDTHVHVRYVDKPEAMFFVDADLHDEDALVADIVGETGLDVNEVREALTYME